MVHVVSELETNDASAAFETFPTYTLQSRSTPHVSKAKPAIPSCLQKSSAQGSIVVRAGRAYSKTDTCTSSVGAATVRDYVAGREKATCGKFDTRCPRFPQKGNPFLGHYYALSRPSSLQMLYRGVHRAIQGPENRCHCWWGFIAHANTRRNL